MKAYFIHVCDPGHGWLKVTVKDLEKVGLKPTDFTAYSMRSGRNCYLEEDCDAGKFIDAWRTKFGPTEGLVFSRYVEKTSIRYMKSIHS